MKKTQTNGKINGIGSAAVAEKTGKNWMEWLALLDAAGATQLTHQQIVAHLRENHQVPDWWVQMITVGYEQERGLRQKHEKPGGFEVSVSKTINVPLPYLFDAWTDDAELARWLGRRKVTIRKATPNKSLRITWDKGKSDLSVDFYGKDATKSQVTCQHSKLPGQAEVEKMRAFWAAMLESLKEKLEA